jgi:hypothetical protein
MTQKRTIEFTQEQFEHVRYMLHEHDIEYGGLDVELRIKFELTDKDIAKRNEEYYELHRWKPPY